MDSLPVLDLSGLAVGGSRTQEFLDVLRTATHDVGFFYLVGHGVPQDLMDTVISTARQFFALPEADKLAIENVNSPHFRGYTRVGGERTQGKADRREQIDIGPERPPVAPGPGVPDWERMEGPNQWPAAMPELRPLVDRWHAEMMRVSQELLHAWALALGQPAEVFDVAFADRPSTLLKIIRYPGRPEGVGAAGQGVGSHKDGGVLTLLLVEPGTAGLQVEHPQGWIDAPPIPGAFVVNIGELLEVATTATSRPRCTACCPRRRVPIASRCRSSTTRHCRPTSRCSTCRPSWQRSHRRHRRPGEPIHATYGANLLKSRLRAHPDVAARHQADLLR